MLMGELFKEGDNYVVYSAHILILIVQIDIIETVLVLGFKETCILYILIV